jgi:hypothetical protein
MKVKVIYATTDNCSVLKKVYRELISQQEGLCGRCPYHGGENAYRKRKDSRCWKRYRKTQWKYKE